MKNKQYWLFKTFDNNHCLEKNTANYGWSDFDLFIFKDNNDEINKKFTTRSEQVRNVLEMKCGDILIVPLKKEGGIAIAEITSDHIKYSDDQGLYEKDMSNYFDIKWISKYISRRDLTSDFQKTLDFPKANLNIYYYKDEIEKLISKI